MAAPAATAGATCASTGVTKRFGSFVAVDDLDLDDPDRLVLRAARPVRLRQDDDAADGRRAGGADRRHDPHRRTRTSPTPSRTSGRSTPSSRATRCSRTSTSSRTSRSGCAGAASRTCEAKVERGARAGRARRTWPGASRPSSPAASSSGSRWPGRIVNRPGRAAARRAARRARPQAAPADADRAQADPDRGRPHVRARHPRPGGGHDDGRHHRGDERTGGSSSSARPAELYESPATAFVANFLGQSNLLAGRRGRHAPATIGRARRRTGSRSRCRPPRARSAGRRPARSASGRRRSSCEPDGAAGRRPGRNALPGGVVTDAASPGSARSTSCAAVRAGADGLRAEPRRRRRLAPGHARSTCTGTRRTPSRWTRADDVDAGVEHDEGVTPRPGRLTRARRPSERRRPASRQASPRTPRHRAAGAPEAPGRRRGRRSRRTSCCCRAWPGWRSSSSCRCSRCSRRSLQTRPPGAEIGVYTQTFRFANYADALDRVRPQFLRSFLYAGSPPCWRC